MKKLLHVAVLLFFHLNCSAQMPGVKLEWKCNYRIQSGDISFAHMATGEDNSVLIQVEDPNSWNNESLNLWIDQHGTLIAEIDYLPLNSTIPGEINDVVFVSSTRLVVTYDENSHEGTPPGHLYSAFVTPEKTIREFVEEIGVTRHLWGNLNPPPGGFVVYDNGFKFYSVSDNFDIPDPDPPVVEPDPPVVEPNPKLLQNLVISVTKGNYETGNSIYGYEISITGKGTPWKQFQVLVNHTLSSEFESMYSPMRNDVGPDGSFNWKMYTDYLGSSRFFIFKEIP